MLTAYQNPIYADATSFLVFVGEPNIELAWSVTEGPGTVEALSVSTDALGRAAAIYRADGIPGTATIQVQHGS